MVNIHDIIMIRIMKGKKTKNANYLNIQKKVFQF